MTVELGKIVTVKLGGSAMDEPRVVHQLAEDISMLLKKKIGFIVVHGGGKAISREMDAVGIKPRKIAGLRVHDDATMAIVERVMTRTNSQICKTFEEFNVPVSPIIGASGLLICEKLSLISSSKDGISSRADLGRVGNVVKVNADRLISEIGNGKVPIVAPIGIDTNGITLNVNADTAAGSIAGACSDEFILLTDVDGILVTVSGKQELMGKLSANAVRKLMRDGVLKDGMIPKAEACMHALSSGVKTARIVNGLIEHPLKGTFSDESLGTVITSGESRI